jgi:FkbM family methyltransferase
MPADSLPRRLAKRALRPLLNDSVYRFLQAGAMAWDIARGNWTEAELPLVPHLVHAGDTVIDIGANYGLYAYHLSRAVGATGHVHAFEPIPFTSSTFQLVARALRFRNVTLYKEGAGDRNGEVTFQLPVQASGAPAAGQAHLGGRANDAPGMQRFHDFPGTRDVTCKLVRLDDRLAGVREVSFIKADIEGSELYAFRGAQQLIERDCPTVLCEINTWFLQGFGIPLEDLLGFFGQRGYQLHFFDAAKQKLVPAQVQPDTAENFVFLHPRRRERLARFLD